MQRVEGHAASRAAKCSEALALEVCIIDARAMQHVNTLLTRAHAHMLQIRAHASERALGTTLWHLKPTSHSERQPQHWRQISAWHRPSAVQGSIFLLDTAPGVKEALDDMGPPMCGHDVRVHLPL